MEINKVRLSELNSDEKNARRHPDRNISETLRSLQEFGQHAPLVVQRGTYKVLVGNGRLEAMRRLGWESADVYFVDDDDETAIRRALADNRTAELAEWDDDMLQQLLSELNREDIIGWDDSELNILLDNLRFDEVSEDDFIPEEHLPEEPFSRIGDIWQLGPHRLMCGDATKGADVQTLMDGEPAQMIFTDPPWNVDYGSCDHPSWKTGRKILNDNMSSEDFRAFLLSAVNNIKSISLPGCMVYIVMSAQEWGGLMDIMRETGWHWSSTIIWKKDSLVLSRKDYHTQYEPIWYGWLEDSRLCPLDDRTQSDVWDIPRPKRSDEHPTMKPLSLVARAIQNSSRPGDIVGDFFGGSGSTLVAADQTGRICRMMELAPEYCDVIVKRYELYKGSKEGISLLRDGQVIKASEIG